MNEAFVGETMINVGDCVNLGSLPLSELQEITKRQSRIAFEVIIIHYPQFLVIVTNKTGTCEDGAISKAQKAQI